MKTLKYLLCGITMCALACSSSKDDGPGPDKGESNTLKIMSFNVRCITDKDEGDTHWDMRKAAVVKMINTVKPDVVGLQEPRTVQRTYLKNNLPNYGYLEVPGTGDGKGGARNGLPGYTGPAQGRGTGGPEGYGRPAHSHL